MCCMDLSRYYWQQLKMWKLCWSGATASPKYTKHANIYHTFWDDSIVCTVMSIMYASGAARVINACMDVYVCWQRTELCASLFHSIQSLSGEASRHCTEAYTEELESLDQM